MQMTANRLKWLIIAVQQLVYQYEAMFQGRLPDIYIYIYIYGLVDVQSIKAQWKCTAPESNPSTAGTVKVTRTPESLTSMLPAGRKATPGLMSRCA